MTHYTDFCSKYKKDGTEKPGWSSELPSIAKTGKKKKNESYVQLKKSFSNLKNVVTKENKCAAFCKKKCYHISENDSNSE